MKFDILTLFPEMLSPLHESMLGRAEKNGLLYFDVIDIREFSKDKHKKTDDTPFGGGHGMVMMPQPLFEAFSYVGLGQNDSAAPDNAGSAMSGTNGGKRKRAIYMSPRGRLLDGELAEELSHEEELVILAGHYEGVDQRVIDSFGLEEVSIGDYVLTGGELPAMVLIDAVARMIPGVIAKETAIMDESVYSGLLEYPQYTQPREYEGREVPEVLLNGDHEKIRLWKFEQALRITRDRRPDLLEKFLAEHDDFDKKEREIIQNVVNCDSNTTKCGV